MLDDADFWDAVDIDYSEKEIELFYKKDLLGTLGNFLARSMTSKLLSKLSSPELLSIKPEKVHEEDEEVLKALEDLPGKFSFFSKIEENFHSFSKISFIESF